MSEHMFILWIMLAYLLLYIIRVVKGPSAWDRLLGLNLISTKIIIIIMLFASVHETSHLLDFAIVYAILGFIGTVFIAVFIVERKKRERMQYGNNR